MQEISVTDILIDDIDSPSFHDRSYVDTDGIVALARSISNTGMMIEPIVVRKLHGRYERLAGHRRIEAAKLLGWATIPAKIVECDDDEALLVMIMENTEREELNAYDRIRSILQYLSVRSKKSEDEVRSLVYRARNLSLGNVKGDDKNAQKDIKKIEEMLALFNLKLSSFANFLRALQFDAEIVRAMRKHNLSFYLAQQINKVSIDKPFMRILISLAIEGELTVKEAAAKVKEWEDARRGYSDNKGEAILSKARTLFKKDRLLSLSSNELARLENLLQEIESMLEKRVSA